MIRDVWKVTTPELSQLQKQRKRRSTDLLSVVLFKASTEEPERKYTSDKSKIFHILKHMGSFVI